ncbi:MAG: tRNA lysidine(34) synthetase TilS [Bacteroidales bacterium]|jgi:tRNA(Ile)-lysidine synthase|nr:tRNA lysidine(34) synthetase TilS [Bacteroidales bacterium]
MAENLSYQFIEMLSALEPDVKQRKFVLAVSGGADSMAMLSLAHKHGLKAIVAHCNFNLRGDESDEDEMFVRTWAERFSYDIKVARFQTKDYAKQHGISIQMAARDLRYDWFESLRRQTACDYVILAHHRDDLVETMLINLTRGTGIKGLTGMQVRNGYLLRPMLNLSRQEIEVYLKEENLDFREDSSNAETKYLRNHIRHRVIPAFQEAAPDFMQRMTDNAARFRENSDLLEHFLSFMKASICFRHENGDMMIDIKHPLVNEMALFELLQTYGFHRAQIADLYASDLSGKHVMSTDYMLLSDRDQWILRERQNETFTSGYIQSGDEEFHGDIDLRLRIVDVNDVSFSDNPNQVFLDYDKLKFPLEVRAWREGDRFTPLGMKGSQKLSDFFINRKLSVLEKQDVRLVCSEGKIVWVIGYQIDDAFKITETSQGSLCINKR